MGGIPEERFRRRVATHEELLAFASHMLKIGSGGCTHLARAVLTDHYACHLITKTIASAFGRFSLHPATNAQQSPMAWCGLALTSAVAENRIPTLRLPVLEVRHLRRDV